MLLAALVAVSWAFAPTDAHAQRRGQAQKKPPSARPGDKKAGTKGLEELLKKSEGEDSSAMAAPARLPQGKEVSREAQADQARDEAIDQLKKIIPMQKNPAVRAEMLFELAELWWEKSKYVYLTEEMPRYSAERDAWFECTREKGEKACPPEPKANTRKSELYRNNAVDLYAQIIKDHPRYGRLDEVRFNLAYNMFEVALTLEGRAREKKVGEAIKQYRDLITQHPHSPAVAEAYVQLGNYYFDSNQLAQARKAFEEAIKLDNPKTQTYAIYKLAWCDINSGEPRDAIRRFKEVIARDESATDKIKLRSEALRDIVQPFSQIDAFEEAIQYFQEKTGQHGSRQYINALASVYFNAGKYEMAINMFRYMKDDLPDDPRAPEWQTKIVLAYGQLNQRDKVLVEMRTLVDSYKPGSAWANKNKDNRVAVEIALNLTEEALYGLVTDYHQEAIKSKSVPTYRLAQQIYAEYVENFPNSERAYQMRYYYAEILYALQEFEPALEQYRIVARDPERDDYKKYAAQNMLLSAEKLLCIDIGRCEKTIDEKSTKIDETRDKGSIEQKQIVKLDRGAEREDLTVAEARLVAACDEYIELVPEAEDEARVRLRAAVIYFDRAQFVEAAQRFGYIINKWPQDRTSATAARLVLESLEMKEEWEELNKLARQFSENKRLLAGREKAQFRTQLQVYIEGSQFKWASTVHAAKDNFRAATMFREFVEEFPQSKFSPVALYNAFVIYREAELLDTAIEMGEKFLAEYPKADTDDMRTLPGSDEKREPILPRLVFQLGKTYEKVADFANAARYYEKFAADFASHADAPDAQFNAGLWYRGLGEPEKAIAAFEKYIKLYRARTPKQREELKLVAEAEVFYAIAQIHEGQRDWKKAADKFAEYERLYRSEPAWKLQNARYRRLLALEKLERGADVLRLAGEIVAAARSLSEEDRQRESMKLAAAHSRFLVEEPKFESYRSIQFGSPRTLAQDLKRKIDSMAAMKKAYTEVVEQGNGDWAIAALVRMAMLPRNFARSLLDAPIPRNLDEDQQEMYRAVLEEKAFEYEEPAIVALETALEKAFELGIYNRWTLEAQRMLAEFKPDLFGEIRKLPLRGSEFFFVAGPDAPAAEGAGGDAR